MGMISRLLTFALVSSTLHVAAAAQSCSDYPYTDSINIEDGGEGLKILSTASVGLDFNDVDSIADARREATLIAKTEIQRFFSETVQVDERITQAIQVTKVMQGDDKAILREETKRTVKSLFSSSAGLLRGVLLLGECYTEGKELRVTVGVKAETISQAGRADEMVSGTAHDSSEPARDRKKLKSSDRYNDSERVRDF